MQLQDTYACEKNNHLVNNALSMSQTLNVHNFLHMIVLRLDKYGVWYPIVFLINLQFWSTWYVFCHLNLCNKSHSTFHPFNMTIQILSQFIFLIINKTIEWDWSEDQFAPLLISINNIMAWMNGKINSFTEKVKKATHADCNN